MFISISYNVGIFIVIFFLTLQEKRKIRKGKYASELTLDIFYEKKSCYIG